MEYLCKGRRYTCTYTCTCRKLRRANGFVAGCAHVTTRDRVVDVTVVCLPAICYTCTCACTCTSVGPRTCSNAEEDTTADIDVEETIASILADNPSVTEVNLNNVSKVTSEHLDQLIEALAANTHISKVQLANTRVKDCHAMVS